MTDLILYILMSGTFLWAAWDQHDPRRKGKHEA